MPFLCARLWFHPACKPIRSWTTLVRIHLPLSCTAWCGRDDAVWLKKHFGGGGERLCTSLMGLLGWRDHLSLVEVELVFFQAEGTLLFLQCQSAWFNGVWVSWEGTGPWGKENPRLCTPIIAWGRCCFQQIGSLRVWKNKIPLMWKLTSQLPKQHSLINIPFWVLDTEGRITPS